MSDCETTGPLPLVSLVEAITVFLVKRVGAKDSNAGPYLDGFQVTLGGKQFFYSKKDGGEERAVAESLEYLLSKASTHTDSQIEEAAAQLVQDEQRETERLLNELAEGGLTDLGKATEDARRERQSTIRTFMNEAERWLVASARAVTPQTLFEEVSAKVPDLEIHEILELYTKG